MRLTAAAVAVVVGSLAFLLCLSANLRAPLSIPLRTDQRTLTRGFYALERNTEHIFAWTSPHAELTLPALDRNVEWRATFEMNVWRPRGVPLPQVRIGVDGAPVTEQMLKGDTVLDITTPRRSDSSGITLSIDTDPAFAPGPRDRRKLGVAVASVTLSPVAATPRMPRAAAISGMAAIAILGAAVAAIRLPTMWVALFAVLVAWGQAALMARGVAPYLSYPSQVLMLAAGLGAGALGVVWMVERLRREPLSQAAASVVAISVAACHLKLLMLVHPNMPIGDGVFHAHRFEYVLAGRLYFTSLTPDNYAFPYPVFLYLVSAPFAWLTADTLERLALLRVVTTVADAAVATMLYWMIVRTTADKMAGIAAVVWYHAMPMTAWIMTWGALTNAFAQTLFVASLALVAGLPVDRTRRATIAMLTAVAAAALLTHPSTCAILVCMLGTTSVLYAWHGGTLRPAAAGVALATALASAIAIVLYYAWFPSVYVSELGRAASVSVSAVSTPAASLSSRFVKAASFGDIYFGWPAVTVAVLGAWRLWQTNPSPRLTLLLTGWAGVSLAFLALGILTPVEMRYHFAAFPALAIAAAFACSWAWRSHATVRLGMAALVAAGIWDGLAQWLWAMTTYARMVK